MPVASWGVCSSRPWPSVWAIQRSDMNPAIDHTTELRHALERSGEPGATELLEALQALLGSAEAAGPTIALTQLKRRVYRPHLQPPEKPMALRDRLLDRLYPALTDAPRRAQVLKEAGGPDTLLHGDLWRANAFVTVIGNGTSVRLIDWDHVGIGPFSYDLSTFLMRFSPAERPWILSRYRQAVALVGWRLPAERELNVLFETAEYARIANRVAWAAMAWLHDGAEWVPVELAEIERWFEALRPVLAE